MKRSEIKRTTPLKQGGSQLRRTPMAGGAGIKARPKTEAKPRQKRCKAKGCGGTYLPDARQPWKCWCSDDCAVAIALAKVEKDDAAKARKERRETKQKLEEMKPLKWWRAKAKRAFHAYVREKAAGHPCISCDTILLKLGRAGGDYDAGHFRSVGSAKHLEFDPRNVWGQCKSCNDHKKGNPQEYERRLRAMKGDSFVDDLLADQSPRRYKAADFQLIEADYMRKLRELKGN